MGGGLSGMASEGGDIQGGLQRMNGISQIKMIGRVAQRRHHKKPPEKT